MDPFETLGVEPRFSLDLDELAARQRELSRALHPDRFVGRPAGERRQALGRAIEVNEAHRTLKNPLSRAEALLARLDLSVAEGGDPPASPDFLMEIMERREELREAGRAMDASKVEHLAEQVRQEERASRAMLAAAFEEILSSKEQPSEEAKAALHQSLGQLRYLRRFLEEADAFLDELL